MGGSWRYFNKIHESKEFSKQKRGVIVALISAGSMINHNALKGVLWENIKEKNGKPGVDDDGNGWIDDVRGINPYSQSVYGFSTPMAGLIAGSANYSSEQLTDPKGKVKILHYKQQIPKKRELPGPSTGSGRMSPMLRSNYQDTFSPQRAPRKNEETKTSSHALRAMADELVVVLRTMPWQAGQVGHWLSKLGRYGDLPLQKKR